MWSRHSRRISLSTYGFCHGDRGEHSKKLGIHFVQSRPPSELLVAILAQAPILSAHKYPENTRRAGPEHQEFRPVTGTLQFWQLSSNPVNVGYAELFGRRDAVCGAHPATIS